MGSLDRNGQKKGATCKSNTLSFLFGLNDYFLCLGSSDTLSFFLPLALLLANTLRPLAVAIRSRNPCLFLLFLFEG